MNASLGRTLAAGVAAVAVLNAATALSMPARSRAVLPGVALLWLALLAMHAALYWFGERVRDRYGLRAYAGAQSVVLFAIVALRVPAPVSIGLFMACTTELIVLASGRWGTTRITLGAIALFVAAAAVGSSLYQATSAGLALALTGVLGHAFVGLARGRAPRDVSAAAARDVAPAGATAISNLSARETEVLRELVSGSRNSEIAAKLGITERTVKSHLKSIYQKLGVESRSAAVATAVQRKLV